MKITITQAHCDRARAAFQLTNALHNPCPGCEKAGGFHTVSQDGTLTCPQCQYEIVTGQTDFAGATWLGLLRNYNPIALALTDALKTKTTVVSAWYPGGNPPVAIIYWPNNDVQKRDMFVYIQPDLAELLNKYWATGEFKPMEVNV